MNRKVRAGLTRWIGSSSTFETQGTPDVARNRKRQNLFRLWAKRTRRRAWLLVALAGSTLTGCHLRHEKLFDDSQRYFQQVATQIEYPDATVVQEPATHGSLSPHSLLNPDQHEFWDLTLDDAIRTALENSEVMRDIGGRVVSPLPVNSSVYDAALAESNPLSGTEAALSAFDAQFDAGILFARNERTFNNFFFGGGVAAFVQNRGDFQAQITKQSAAGTTFAAREHYELRPEQFAH
jgi:hypothetical protein